MKDLRDDEIELGPDTYAGTPSQCPVCENWQVDLVFTVPEDRTELGSMFKAAGQALVGAARAMEAFMEHLRADHPDEDFMEGLARGLDGSSSD